MDTPTAEAGHKEGLVVGAGTEAPDDALLHLVIRPGEPLGLVLGGQVPDCGHTSCPAPGQSFVLHQCQAGHTSCKLKVV